MLIGNCRYAEMRNLYVRQLVYTWAKDPTDKTCVQVGKKIDSFAEGSLEHATEMLSAFWKTVSGDGGVETPSNTSSPVRLSQLRLLSWVE